MKDSALSVANYFLDLAEESGQHIKPLKMMKLVYIAHGFMLAMLDYSVLNPRFDKVEAWKYGPVIPSVYYSFKIYKDHDIDNKTDYMQVNDDKTVTFVTPTLEDDKAKAICRFVWNRYGKLNDSDLVTLLHRPGTPWRMVYEEGKNNPIPDSYTRAYYTKVTNNLLNSTQNGND